MGRDRVRMKTFMAHHLNFNPRARMGRDAYGKLRDIDDIAISIHAPVWGATKRYND